MSTFVLVHGAWHGAWCWQKLIPLLAAKGHKVITPDLPGLGSDQTPVEEISFKAYTDCISEIIEQQNDKVILVGHSMAGMVITQVAEYLPDKIRKLVYLSAYLPRNNEFFLYLAEKLPNGLVNANMLISEDQRTASIREDVITAAFYADCSEADIEMAKALIVPQALAPLMTGVRISDENYGKLRKVYITCSQDQTIPFEAQEMMLAASPCDQVFVMESGHSPFFADPEILAGHLIAL